MTGFKATRTQHLYIRHPSETYYCRVYALGKNKYVCLRTKDYKRAQAMLPSVLMEHKAMASLTGEMTLEARTMGALMALYLARLENDISKKPATVTYRKLCIKVLKDSFEGIENMEPRLISLYMLLGWSRKAFERYSGTLYNNVLGTLRELLNDAVKQNLCTENLANKIKRAKVESKIPWLPSKEQFRTLIKEIRSARHASAYGAADLIELMAYTGLRIGQATSLEWEDIDLENKRIRLKAFKHSDPRFIPIIPDMEILIKSIAEGRFYKDKSRIGKVISVSRCDDSLKNACVRLGYPKMCHHDWRHFYTTSCLEAGIPIATVAQWRGDKDGGACLLKIYGHLRDDHSQEMAKKLSF